MTLKDYGGGLFLVSATAWFVSMMISLLPDIEPQSQVFLRELCIGGMIIGIGLNVTEKP